MAGLAPKGQRVVFDPAKHCGVVRNKRDGKPCRRSKGYGTDHLGIGPCKFHLGNTRNVIRAAARFKAQQALVRLGQPIEQDPQQALLELVWEAAGNVAFLRQEVGKLGGALVGDVKSLDREGAEHAVSEDVRALVKLYGDWTDKLAKYSKACIDAGIAERQVQLAEAQGYAIRDLIESVLDALNLDEDQRQVGRQVAGQKLRVLAGGVAA